MTEQLTDPWTLAQITERAESEGDAGDFRLRIAQGLPATAAWDRSQCEVFVQRLTAHSAAYLRHHYEQMIRRFNATLADALRERLPDAEFDALVQQRRFSWCPAELDALGDDESDERPTAA